MKRILLDTNAYVRLLGGDDAVLDALAEAETVFMSVIVLGELHAGFHGGSRHEQNLKRLDSFLHKSTVRILPATSETALIFGELKDRLRRRGRPIPINDVWIAAQVIETGSVLVTFDVHFQEIDGVRVWSRSTTSSETDVKGP